MIENSKFNSSQLETIGDIEMPNETKKLWRSNKPKKAFNGYNYQGEVFTIDQQDEFLEKAFAKATFKRQSQQLLYYNIPASFDIETTSFYRYTGEMLGEGEPEIEKQATMYIWQFGVNGYTIYGRTWFEFGSFINNLVNYGKLNSRCRLIIYVHNLSFEFQFIKDWFKWDKVFSMKSRRPLTAISGGLEFRCSYYLSNYNLGYLGENLLMKYKVNKLIGNLDYDKIRNSKTPLTQDELDYAVNDVRVVMAYIQEKIENEDGITNIPLTNTGYVRKYCRERCFGEFDGATDDDHRDGMNYRAIMKSLKINDHIEYLQLKDAFMGGFTHANVMYSNQLLENVNVNCDKASSYPAQLVLKYFPMSSSIYIGNISNSSQLEYYLKNYCCLFDLYIENIRPLVTFENILSVSRCTFLDDCKYISNNGRIVSYEGCLKTTVTEIDYHYLNKFYDWDGIYIKNFRIYNRGYLPTPLVKAVLELYKNKTTLKNVDGKETEYMVSKNMTNSSYGMTVTDIIRDEFTYDEFGWGVEKPDGDESITKYNKNFQRFLFYPWGVWVTAHARADLYDAILELKEDYVYSDTDCTKGLNYEKHAKWFEDTNMRIYAMCIRSSARHNIPIEYFMPKTIKGEVKMIGAWEQETPYVNFKTNGAKRYIYTYYKNDELKMGMTVAGVNKRTALPYLLDTYGDYESVFQVFENGLIIPEDHSGKLTHTYIDEVQTGEITDYLGNKAEYYEKSSIHLEKTSFVMSMLDQYINLIKGVQEVGTFEKL